MKHETTNTITKDNSKPTDMTDRNESNRNKINRNAIDRKLTTIRITHALSRIINEHEKETRVSENREEEISRDQSMSVDSSLQQLKI